MKIAGGVPGKISSPVGKPVYEHPTEDLIMGYRLTRPEEIQMHNKRRRLAMFLRSDDCLINAEGDFGETPRPALDREAVRS